MEPRPRAAVLNLIALTLTIVTAILGLNGWFVTAAISSGIVFVCWVAEFTILRNNKEMADFSFEWWICSLCITLSGANFLLRMKGLLG